MALLKRPAERRALTASSAAVPLTRNSWRGWRFGDDEWQQEAWRVYDIIGELRFVSNFVGGAISRCRLYVAKVDKSGEAGEEVTRDPVASLAQIPLGSGNQRDENLRMLGIDLFVPGEAFIVGESRPGDTPDVWFVVAGRQVQKNGDQIQVPRPKEQGGGKLNLRPGLDRLIRVWTPHPSSIDNPDSPTRSAIPILREIELLTKREFAELDSRLTGAGVWFLPEGLDFPGGDDDEQNNLVSLHKRLQTAADTSVNDQGDASALTPILATIPDQFVEHADKLKPINFWSELSEHIGPMKTAAIQRLALALDVPPEVLTGVGSSNRWNAWLADEQVVKIHIEPLLSRIAESLTKDWLRDAIEGMGLDPLAYMFAFDTAKLTVRPNRIKDALDFWDRGMINDETARDAGAFGRGGIEPSQEERNRRLMERVVEREPGFLSNPIVQEILGLPPLGEPKELEPGRPRETDPDDPDDQRALPDSEDERPGAGDEKDEEQAQKQATRLEAVLTASTMAVMRALELAGGRLTTPGERRHRYADTPRHELHTKIGAINKADAEKALAGAWSHVNIIANGFALDNKDLTHVLHGYCVELMTRNLAHSEDLLRAAIHTAMAGRRN